MSILNLKIELDGFEESTLEAKVHFSNEDLHLLPGRSKTAITYMLEELAEAAEGDKKVVEKKETLTLPDEDELMQALTNFYAWVRENYPECIDEYTEENEQESE